MKEMYEFFKVYMDKEKQYFVGDADYDQFFQATLNERMRNVFVFYVMSDIGLFRRFVRKTHTDSHASEMMENLYLALILSKKSENTRHFAQYLINKFFKSFQFVLYRRDNGSALQMKKYLESFTIKYRQSQQSELPEIEQRMKEIDFTNLV